MFYFPPCTPVQLLISINILSANHIACRHVSMVKQYREQYKSMDLIGLLLVV